VIPSRLQQIFPDRERADAGRRAEALAARDNGTGTAAATLASAMEPFLTTRPPRKAAVVTLFLAFIDSPTSELLPA